MDTEEKQKIQPLGGGLPLRSEPEVDNSLLHNNMTRLSLGPSQSVDSASKISSDTTSGTAESLPRSSPAMIRRTPSSTSLTSNSPKQPLRKYPSLSSVRDGQSTPPASPKNSSRRPSPGISTAMSGRQSSASFEAPKQSITAASVAKDSFSRELESQNLDCITSVIVILHDSCYGHRYSRPRTTKATLSTIVERPERILATVLGTSAAYVLLGGRYAEAPNAPNMSATPEHRPFTIYKSSRLVALGTPAVTSVHGTKWMAELKTMCEGAEAKLAMNGKELERPSARLAESKETRPKLHEGDLYLCSESLDALEGALGAVFDAVDAVFSPSPTKRAFVAVRPPGHHCSDDYPSGFCWINNVHIGISHAASTHGLTHAAIIDFDLHHGDGSQDIAWDHNSKLSSLPKNTPASKKYPVGYFSLHDINSYPCEWGDEEKVRSASMCIENAHGQTIWNVHLQPWGSDADFWRLYDERYSVILEKTRSFLRGQYDELQKSGLCPKPKGAIFISAGFDASMWEGHGMQRHNVNVPTDFYARFTQDIVNLANEEGLGVEGRVISVLEGGYSDRALTSGTLSHICGLYQPTAFSNLAQYPGVPPSNSNKFRDGTVSLQPGKEKFDLNGMALEIKPDWWGVSRLEELEGQISPVPTAAPPRRPRGPISPTYSTPTQSYTAKIVSPSNPRRSTSGSFAKQQHVQPAQRIPTPPPPDVDWVTAAHELSKCLIPSDRQTRSCRPEDLNAEATKARRMRQSAIGVSDDVPTEDIKRMQLRGRKSKAPTTRIDEVPEPRPLSQASSSRRKTIAGIAELEEISNAPERLVSNRVPSGRRRVSMASVASTGGQDGATAVPQIEARAPLAVSKPKAAPKPRVSKKQPIPKATSPESLLPSKSNDLMDTGLQSSGLHLSTKAGEADSLKELPKESTSQLDALERDMKKMSIKLNVPSKEEHDVKEARKKMLSKPARKPTVPKPARAQSKVKQTVLKPSLAAAQASNVSIINDANVEAKHDAPDVTLEQLSTVPNLISSTDKMDLDTPPEDRVSSDKLESTFKQQRTAGSAETAISDGLGPKQFMSYVPSSPLNKMSKSDLPIFSNSSPIRFSTVADVSENGVKSEDIKLE